MLTEPIYNGICKTLGLVDKKFIWEGDEPPPTEIEAMDHLPPPGPVISPYTPLSKHFMVGDFAQCHYPGLGMRPQPYPSSWVYTRLISLVHALEVIQAEIGSTPLRVLSGYRSPGYNASSACCIAIPRSQHIYGRAADIYTDGMSSRDLYTVASELYKEGKLKIGGLGYYHGFVHVDIREEPDGYIRRWGL